MKKEVSSEDIMPKGPYSPAVLVDNWLFISGQIASSDSMGDIKSETLCALDNVRKLLESAGMGLENVVKVILYVKDGENFNEINEIYKGFFQKPYPARSTVFVSCLPKNARIEIEAIARR